jgi:hypothetical protein
LAKYLLGEKQIPDVQQRETQAANELAGDMDSIVPTEQSRIIA